MTSLLSEGKGPGASGEWGWEREKEERSEAGTEGELRETRDGGKEAGRDGENGRNREETTVVR